MSGTRSVRPIGSAVAVAAVFVALNLLRTFGTSSAAEVHAPTACYSPNISVSPSARGIMSGSPSLHCGGVTNTAGTAVQFVAQPEVSYVFTSTSRYGNPLCQYEVRQIAPRN